MLHATRHRMGVAVLTVLYPVFAPLVRLLPNPMVPGASLALNMVFPVLAGYLYGPRSGAVTGGLGTGLSALLLANRFDALAVLPHAVMGGLAGYLGRDRSELLASIALLAGHVLNLLFFIRFGLLSVTAETLPATLLGLLTEIPVGMVLVVLLAAFLKQRLYCAERW